MLLVLVEHDRGLLAPATAEAMAFARTLGRDLGVAVHAVTLGASADALAADLGTLGAASVHQVDHPLLTDFGPEAWGSALAQAIRALAPVAIVATGTDRGNEVVAHAAAHLDVAFAANVTSVLPGDDGWDLVRVRWGGSLLEHAALSGAPVLLTTALHAIAGDPAEVPAAGTPIALPVEIDALFARTVVADRVERAAGVTLATAPVVVSGGRGVGSAEAFAPLQDLASLLGGVVGCSRAVTNNGWRPHTDQVGQTGTRIAPEIYIACGISGAIQHWVGAMASKRILAINTDKEANMVAKADYAVIGDLHTVVPAIAAEIRRRQS